MVSLPGFNLWCGHGRRVSPSCQRHQLELVARGHRPEYRYAGSGRPVQSDPIPPRRQIPICCWLLHSVKVHSPSTWHRCCSRRPCRLDASSNSGTAPDGSTLVTDPQPIIDGLSEITAFGDATRITIVDETPGDSTFGQIIGGFDPTNVANTNVAANWTNALGNFSVQVNAGEFTSNGLKTVKIYATDNAGSIGNPVTLQFTLAVTGISAPTPPTTPTGLELAPYDVTGAPGYTNIATPNIIGLTTPGATVELLQANGNPFSPAVFATSDSVTGAVHFDVP